MKSGAPSNPAVVLSDGAVRERLLSGALDLFTTKGYAATTVREIVERAGVTKPVLYYYFRSKEGIYFELMRTALEEYTALLAQVLERPGSPRERIVGLAVRTYGLVRTHLGIARLMYAIHYGPPQGAPFFDFDAFHMSYQEAVRRLVDDGIAAGEIRKGAPGDIMWALIGVLNVAIEVELCHPEQSIGEEGLERILEMILDGLARQSDTGGME